MRQFFQKIRAWWLFKMSNPVVRKGEKGGFKWVFRRFWLEISTVSGNFKARFMAAEHPYGYLVSGKDDKNIEGFCQMIYTVGMLLTTDQGFVDDVRKAIGKYQKRLDKENPVVEDEIEEKFAIENEKKVLELSKVPKKRLHRSDRAEK